MTALASSWSNVTTAKKYAVETDTEETESASLVTNYMNETALYVTTDALEHTRFEWRSCSILYQNGHVVSDEIAIELQYGFNQDTKIYERSICDISNNYSPKSKRDQDTLIIHLQH